MPILQLPNPGSGMHLHHLSPAQRAIPVQGGTPLRLPGQFERLVDLAYNLWWTWDPAAAELWAAIDPRRWIERRNPLTLLHGVDGETWEALAANGSFLDSYNKVLRRFDAYMSNPETWFASRLGKPLRGPVVYMCTEFGIHHTLPLYSGGLGVLAGDHVKAASDLGVPLVGVGMLYRRFFSQTVDPDGNQQHNYLNMPLVRRPLRRVLDRHGHALTARIALPGRRVAVGAWRLDVGRVPVLLLDTDLAENDPADRPISHLLYVRSREMRLAQEIVLGIGGVRIVEDLGLNPAVWHVNEGHSALGLLDRLSTEVQAGSSFDEARRVVEGRTLFTLHTPVPAGNEVFPATEVAAHLNGSLPGIDEQTLRDLGVPVDGDETSFDLSALAVRLAGITNGVSKRHAEVVSERWSSVKGEPTVAITNGVHTPTWVGRAMTRVYEQAVGRDWPSRLVDLPAWKQVLEVPDEVVWEAHERQKEEMLRHLRARLREQWARHGEGPQTLRRAATQLPPSCLTIVYARRFATYKRAGLLLSDPGRARNILTSSSHPVQVVFAGKAHPADREGQALIRWVVEMARSADLAGHIHFVEDYDMEVARQLVGGADVWLNHPRPPQEASGTSGMKAAANGVVNLSVLDGWWLEGHADDLGWGFGRRHNSDAEDAGLLYHLLESEVVPEFYDRDDAGIPRRWVQRMKQSMARLTPAFSTHRMMTDYVERAYSRLDGDS